MKKKRDLMPSRLKRAKKILHDLSHTYIRKRDSIYEDKIAGYCFDCGKPAEGVMFQAGHWIPDSVGGATLRYHPDNMHGQAGGCNAHFQQEKVKVDYTLKMVEIYGMERVEALKALKNRTIKADILWYEKMIELYTKAVEKDIVHFLES